MRLRKWVVYLLVILLDLVMLNVVRFETLETLLAVLCLLFIFNLLIIGLKEDNII